MKSHWAKIVFGIFVLVTLTSCTTYRVLDTVRSLNQVETSQDEWGKITISGFSLVANKGQFKVAANEDATNYIQAARLNISGAASSAQQSALFLAGQGSASFIPPVYAGAPPNTTNSSPLPALPNQAETAVNAFVSAANINGLTPAADERDAVEKGINDKTAETLLESLLNPTVNSNKQAVIFGVMQVTCQPGQWTRNGYVGELDVNLRYANSASNRICTNNAPNVLAVLPLMDSKNMEFRNSDQNQIELALALQAAFAAKGMTAAANLLSDYVKREQSNVDTRNQDPVVTTYADNDSFGFQIYPALRGLKKPGKSSSKAGYDLQPVTFPLVVAVLLNKDEVVTNEELHTSIDSIQATPQTRWIAAKQSAITSWLYNNYWYSFFGYSQQFASIFSALTSAPINTNTTFLGQIKSSKEVDVFAMGLGDISSGYAYNLPGNPMFQRLQRALMLDEADRDLKILKIHGFDSDYTNSYREMFTAYKALESSAASQPSCCILPDLTELFPAPADTNSPSIVGVYPKQMWRDRKMEFTIVLTGVTDKEMIQDVQVQGQPCDVTDKVVYSTKAASGAYKETGIALNIKLQKPFNTLTNNVTNNIDFTVNFIGKSFTAPVTLMTLAANESVPLGLNPKAGGTEINIGNAATPPATLTVGTDCAKITATGNYKLKTASPPGNSSVYVYVINSCDTKTNASLAISSDEISDPIFNVNTDTWTFKNKPTVLSFTPGQNSFAVVGTEHFDTALKPAYLSVPMTLIGNAKQNPAVVIQRDTAEKIIGVELKAQGSDKSMDNSNMVERIQQILQTSEHVPDPVNIVH